MLDTIFSGEGTSIHKINDKGKTRVNRYIISTQNTRKICNDPFLCGVAYTRALREACTAALAAMQHKGIIHLEERKAIVFNVLRGGLNFGLREALADAFSWNLHGSSFISAQRARVDDKSEHWHIIESDYRKVYMPGDAQIIIGDVVATGTSLAHALDALLKEALQTGVSLESILFFTFGGKRAEELLEDVDRKCRQEFPQYRGTNLCYIEGRFTVPEKGTPLHIRVTGTDLIKLDALLAPEYVESQYEHPAYPIERCAIYDAGSRAFWLPEYLEDVRMYWKQTLGLASAGTGYTDLLHERFPLLEPDRFGPVDLKELCTEHIKKLDRLITKGSRHETD